MWCMLAARSSPAAHTDPGAGETAGLDRDPSGHLVGREASDPRRERNTQPPSGALPATAMSPPRETRTATPVDSEISRATRSAVSAFADAPRSSSTPAGRRAVREPGSSSISAQRPDGTNVAATSEPSRSATLRERPVVAGEAAWPSRPSDRRARRSCVRCRARRREPPRGRGRPVVGAPAARFNRCSSESGRNRLHARSTARSSRRRVARASRRRRAR